jgi:hypothetical protein
MKRALAFVLIFVSVFMSYSQNLVENPGFESWQKINKPTGWTTALSCLKDSAIIFTGTYSCMQSTTTESKELGQLIPVKGGSRYTISFRYRNDQAATGNGCRIWSNWKDADGNAIADEISLPLLHSGYLKSDKWNEYSADVTAPPYACFFNLVIRTLPNSITWWDDIVLEENISTVKKDTEFNRILIYPNPAHNYLIICNMQNVQYINIHTSTGSRIKSFKTAGEERIMIPLSDLKAGIYIMCIESSGKRYIRKFIKASD